MNLIISILIVYGMSAIVTQSKIFEPLRDFAAKKSPNFWKHLTSCMQCFPFWGGVFVSLIIGTPFQIDNDQLPLVLNSFFTFLFVGSLFSGTTMFINTIHLYIKSIIVEKPSNKEIHNKEVDEVASNARQFMN